MVYLVFQVFLIEFLKLTVAFFSKLFLLELLVLVHLCDKDDLSCLAGRHRLFHDGSKFLGAHALFKEPCLFLVAARNGKSVVEKNGNNTLKSDGETAGRCVHACEFSDHLVVSSAAGYGTSEAFHGNLEDGSCVVAHSAD